METRYHEEKKRRGLGKGTTLGFVVCWLVRRLDLRCCLSGALVVPLRGVDFVSWVLFSCFRGCLRLVGIRVDREANMFSIFTLS